MRFIQWLRSLIWGRELRSYLEETKIVKVEGIVFEIRRLNIYDYLDGSKTLTTYYQLYKSGKVEEAEANFKKVLSHYKDCFMAAVVSPALKRVDDPKDIAIFVDELTEDLRLAGALYAEIVAYTDGKKKRIQ